MLIGVPKEIAARETRVAATPETVKKLVALGYQVKVEAGAGFAASYLDEDYSAAGAELCTNAKDAVAGADVVLKIISPTGEEAANYKQGALVLASFAPHQNPYLEDYAKQQLTCIAMELIPRITRAQSVDILSSQGNLAGYKAVLMAANEYAGMLPMMMTAAGTIKPAKVLVLGAGVAGLQAIATAKRLGALVEASDLRPAAKEQVESLGGKWLDVPMSDEEKAQAEGTGGYAWVPSEDYIKAQAEIVDKAISQANIVITTALVPGRKAPTLVRKESLAKMQAGSILVDMAAASGGNIEGTVQDEVVTLDKGIKILGMGNLPALLATEASALFARNLLNFITSQQNAETKAFELNKEDEMVTPAIIVDGGKVIFQQPN